MLLLAAGCQARLPYTPAGISGNSAVEQSVPGETYQLPATWTPEDLPAEATREAGGPASSELLEAGMTLRPTATLPLTATPLPSLTPFDGAIIVIGYSVEGRPLEVTRFGNGRHKRMIVAGMHGGNEWNTIALADELIAHLRKHPELVPEDVTLFILRSLNPDGEARSHTSDGRTNANGVDLNRNWSVDWRPDWPRKGCWTMRPVTGGTAPASEPETQYLMAFLIAHPVDALVNYHSAALGIFPAGDPPDPHSASLAQAIDDVSPYLYPPIDTGCTFTGTMVDWVAEMGGAAVDLELLDHEHTDFEINLRVLAVLLSWAP